MLRAALLTAFAVVAASCGGIKQIACNNAAGFMCQQTNVTGGLVITTGCPAPFVEVASCPTAGIVGTCTTTQTGLTVDGSTGDRTNVVHAYTGINVAEAQASCTSTAGAAWTTP
jgi:hypothetical protein